MCSEPQQRRRNGIAASDFFFSPVTGKQTQPQRVDSRPLQAGKLRLNAALDNSRALLD